MSSLSSQSHSVDVAPISSLDVAPISSLLAMIRTRCNPLAVWLFGSRAKGSPREDSDWDLLVVLPDEVSNEKMFTDNPPSKFGRATNINADIIYCNETEFFESTSVPNTLAYEVARTGVELT